ncbi:MAG: PilZ domain-containing protein [Deferribacteres bacterium]|nr:PilZ domain-containing protein [Deferribacteres bacterium]
MALEQHYDEKRLFCRLTVDAELTYTIAGEDGTYKGQCRNLSHTGIQFVTDQALPEGKAIEVVIDTKSVKFNPMKAVVEVVRVEPSGDSRYKTAGIIKKYR